MRPLLPRPVAGLLLLVLVTAPAAAQDFVLATPLPPGPGVLPRTYPAAPLAAPVTTLEADHPRAGRFYASADFLYGATQGVFVPPLVTLSPGTAPVGAAGALFNPNTTVVFGGRRDLNSTRPGFWLNVGYWCDDDHTRGVDAGYFFLGGLSERFIGSSGPGGVTLARPVVNGLTATNVGVPVAGPVPGGITASADTWVVGADVNWRRALVCGECCRADLLVGYRYLHLGDSVDVWHTSGAGAGLVAFPAGALVHDSFRTRNAFHGPQLGLVTNFRLMSGLHVGVVTKVAMGVTVAEANADGTAQGPAILLPAGVPTGLLVGPTNGGARAASDFAVVPEAGLRFGYDVTPEARLNVGYSFVYWSRVRRAADQIDLTVLSAGRPAFRNDTTDVWVQGWTVGFTVNF